MVSNLSRSFLRWSRPVFRSCDYDCLMNIKRIKNKQHEHLISRYLYSGLNLNSPFVTNSPEDDEFDNENSVNLEVNFAKLTGNDPVKIRKVKLIQLEMDMLRQQGEEVPNDLNMDHWIDLLKLDTLASRSKFYRFLWLNEMKKKRYLEKKAEQRLKYLQQKEAEPEIEYNFTTNGPIVYNLKYNSLIFRVHDQTINRLYNLKLLYASMYASHIIVDCSYESFMCQRNMHYCAKQMLLMWSENREHENPFHLNFCNMKGDSELRRLLLRTLKRIDDPDFPFYSTPQHYLDLYPKEKLVYLTPHCLDDLTDYNHDDIYIIGGFVDRNKCEPLSLAKAKKEGLRMAKFPLDRYLRWRLGTKLLPLNQCLAIMNDLKVTNDWRYSFRHISPRKLRTGELTTEEEVEKNTMDTLSKSIRESHRRNLVYDLLMKENFPSAKKKE